MKVQISDRIGSVQEYYFAKKLREIAQMNQEAATRKVINLGIGSPDLPPHPSVVQTLSTYASMPHHHGYQSYRGVAELRQAYALWYQKYYGVVLNPEHEIMPLMGSKEGIMHISMAYLNEGDEVLIPNPGYPTYEAVTKIAGGIPRNYHLKPENDWLIDLDSLAKEDLGKVKLCWVNYPHMPTGAQAPLSFLEELVAFAKEHNILLCHDNPYSFILTETPQSLLQVPNALDTAVELNSLSKSQNMAGWRMGMLAGNSERLNEIAKFKTNMDSGMFLPVQQAAITALSLDKEWYQELNHVYRERRKLAWEIMDFLGCRYRKDSVGMFVWGEVPAGHTASSMSDQYLYGASVFLTPGHIFGSEGNDYIRLSLCSSMPMLAEALERMKQL